VVGVRHNGESLFPSFTSGFAQTLESGIVISPWDIQDFSSFHRLPVAVSPRIPHRCGLYP